MDEIDNNNDELLEKYKGYKTGSSGEFSTISDEDMRTVRLYLQLIWGLKLFEKQKDVQVNEIIDNAQLIFSDFELKQKDKLWMNKLASTLQELVDKHTIANWPLALKCLSTDPKDYVDINNCKKFLNCIKHFKINPAIELVPAILGDEYKNIKEVTEAIFEKICTQFILILSNFFKTQCQK